MSKQKPRPSGRGFFTLELHCEFEFQQDRTYSSSLDSSLWISLHISSTSAFVIGHEITLGVMSRMKLIASAV